MKTILKKLHFFGALKNSYQWAGRAVPFVAAGAVILLSLGIWQGLWVVPADYQQGDGFRIIYIHVPSAFWAMGVYMAMAMSAVIFLVWRIKVAALWIRASAPIGATFAFLALFSGAVWGQPMWGTWWIWDARLTSTLILLFLYGGFMALQSAIPDRNMADRAGALLLLVGVVNIPIIHYSVVWWNSLHQGATLTLWQKPSIDVSMLYPLLLMIGGFFCFYLWTTLLRLRIEILQKDRHSHWVQTLLKGTSALSEEKYHG